MTALVTEVRGKSKRLTVSQCGSCNYNISMTLDMIFSLEMMQTFNFSHLHNSTSLLLVIMDKSQDILIATYF